MLNDLYHMLDPIAFSIGPVTVRWYGLAYIFGFIVAGIVMVRTARRWRIDLSADDIVSVLISIAFGVIIGGRLGYCLFYGNGYYLSHPVEILAINQGGMSFHGGLIGAIVAAFIACRTAYISFATIADLAVIGAPWGLFFGRCANFVNGELWGKPTDLPWGVVFETGGEVPRHPSQLYEALLEGLLMFVILFALSQRRPPRPQGTFLGAFLALYGVFRFLIEFVRVPDAQLGYLLGPITMGQVLSFPLVCLGIWLLVRSRRNNHAQVGHLDSPFTEEEYAEFDR